MLIKNKLDKILTQVIGNPGQELTAFKVGSCTYKKLQDELGRKRVSNYNNTPVIIVRGQKGISYTTQLRLF